MKNKGLKVTLVFAIVLLVSIISFAGFYRKGIYKYEDQIPEYILGDGVTGSRSIVLKPQNVVTEEDKETEKEENEKAENKQEEKDSEENNVEKIEEVKVGNTKEMMNESNFSKAKEIMKTRLDKVSTASYYTIKMDKTTGKIHINVLDNNFLDTVSSIVSAKGEFKILDAETKEVLLDNSKVKKATAQYTQGPTGGMVAFLNVEFDKEGKEKLREISKNYVETTDAEGNKKEKKVTIKIDENELISTVFSEEFKDGNLQLTVGSETRDVSELQKYLVQASNFAVIINKEALPLIYEIDENVYTSLGVTNNQAKNAVIIVSAIAIVLAIFMIGCYKKNGLLGVISIIGMVATLLILIRYTNVVLTAETLSAIVTVVILAYISVGMILKNIKKVDDEAQIKKELKESIIGSIKVLLPITILSIILCFVRWLPVYSFAMTLFWGCLTIILFNITVLRTLVLGTKK